MGCGMEELPVKQDSGRSDMFLIDLHPREVDGRIHTCGDNVCEPPETVLTCPNDCLSIAEKPLVPKIIDPGYVDPLP
jgi:hypothetical protein